MLLGRDAPCPQLVIPGGTRKRTGILAARLGFQDQRSTIESNPHGAAPKQLAYRLLGLRGSPRFSVPRHTASRAIGSTVIAISDASRSTS